MRHWGGCGALLLVVEVGIHAGPWPQHCAPITTYLDNIIDYISFFHSISDAARHGEHILI